MRDLVVVGAGGFGREVLDVVDALNDGPDGAVWRVVGVLDDGPTALNLDRLGRRGIRYLGGVDAFLTSGSSASYVVGIGSPRVRRRIAETFAREGYDAATLIHPEATRGFGVEIGRGSVVCAGVRLTTNIRVGEHAHLNPNVTVGHDTSLGDFVSMNPASSVSGDCSIEDEVLIGVAGVVLNGLTVGARTVVGGSACVVRDVPPDSVVKGVPAR